MKLPIFLARRYMLPRGRHAFHHLITWISVQGMTLGVTVLVIILAVMNGFESEVKERIVGTYAHVMILRFGGDGIDDVENVVRVVQSQDDVVAASPFVYGKAMLSVADKADGVVVRGVIPRGEGEVTMFREFVERDIGNLDLTRGETGRPGIYLGVHVAENLGVTVGEDVVLVSPLGSSRTPMGFIPKMRTFEVRGFFRSGMYEYDSNLAFVDLEEAQSFFSLQDRVTGVGVRVREKDHAPEVASRLTEALGGFPFRTTNWIDMNASLVSWMKIEKLVMSLILGLIILVAAFNIASGLIMAVMDKKRDIGILKSMGVTDGGVMTIFVLKGLVVGGIGATLGAVLGVIACYFLDRYPLQLPAEVYFLETLPVELHLIQVVMVVLGVLLVSFLATLYPAWRASRLVPVDAIRYE